MISATEDELLDALTWSEDFYTLSEFVTEFPLPQVVKVVRGHDGGTDSSTLGYGEVLTIHALRETRILAAEDKNGNAISVGLDFPDEFQILPQVKDCSLYSCGVLDLASFYRTVKYLEVIQAHYGTEDDIDTVDVGELLEILDIHKPHKPEKSKVHVFDLQSNQRSILTSSCSARFRPLLDWKKYKAPELKTHQFGLPVRVRFMDAEVGEDTECQRLISKTVDINVINETDDIIVITTTVSSDPDFKFAFEIPKDLEIKVAVAEGFSNGAKHYTNIVTSLNERFDVTKFMTSHQAAPIKRRDVIKQHGYGAIKEYIIDKSISPPIFDKAEPEPDGPPLPPRPGKIKEKSKSFDIPPTPPPKVPEKPVSKRKNSAPNVETTLPKSKPAVPRRQRSASQNQSDNVHSPPMSNITHVLQSSNIDPNDPSPPEVKDGEDGEATINIPALSPIVPQRTNNHPKSHTERKDSKPPPPSKTPKNIPSTNGQPKPCNLANNPLQAELKEVVAKKRPVKAPRAPIKKDENSKYPQTSNMSETSKETNASNKEKETSQPKDVQSPAKVPAGGIDGPADAQTTINHPAPPSQANENGNAQSRAEMKSPELPPRPQRPKLEDCASNSQGNSSDKIPGKVGQTEDKDQQMVLDEKADTYAPELPLKSPGRQRKIFIESGNYVQPVPPGYQALESVVSHNPPYTPPPKRVTPIARFQRPGTLPKNYRFGENQQEQDKDTEEGIYEMPYVTPVMPVAPQMNRARPQSIHEQNPYELVARVPLDLSGLGITEVADILRNLNMGQYAERFEDELIDGNLLKELKESDLTSLQMESLHRTKLLNFIKGWRPNLTTKMHTM